MEIKAVNIKDKLNSFSDFWNPKIVGELNGQLIKVAKFKGEFVRHQHENEDEMFLVIEGKLLMEFDDKTIEAKAGEFIIVPKTTYHKPIAVGEVQVLLFEPDTTLNTGDANSNLTVNRLEEI